MSCVKQQFLSDISIVPAKQQLPSDVFHLCIFLVRCNVNERSGSVNECLHSLGCLNLKRSKRIVIWFHSRFVKDFNHSCTEFCFEMVIYQLRKILEYQKTLKSCMESNRIIFFIRQSMNVSLTNWGKIQNNASS